MKYFLSFIIFSLFFVFSSYKSSPEVAAFEAVNQTSLQRTDSVTSILFRLESSSQSEMVKVRENAAMNPAGNTLTHDSHSFYNNGAPVFLHSGEIQYFRTPEDQWEDLIIKAKNGGLNCIASYVYWGIHEPKDNIWNFTGRYDIARFLTLCKKHDMFVILRIGPVINGETRNAGLPQWVREQLPGRYNNQLYPSPQWYLDAVGDFYTHLADEVKGFFPSRGGNIILVQIDNETNCSWVWGRAEWQKDAQVTADKYQEMAKTAGFEGPFCATYWETTHTVRPRGAIPATGAYLLGHWNITAEYPKISGFKLVNTKYHFDGFTDTLDYPVIAVENQGGGGYNTIDPPEFPASFNISDIACGTNATNYYMYGAGTNPQRYPGPWFDQYVGSSVARPDVTKMSYDLHTPLGEFQQVRESYHYVRRLGLFLESFGGTVEELAFKATDSNEKIFGKTDQACMREMQGSGFVFVNTYQLPSHDEQTPIEISLQMEDSTIIFPQKSRLHAYQNIPLTMPVRLEMAGLKFLYATANPMTIFHQQENTHLIFYANGSNEAEYFIENISRKNVIFSEGVEFHQADNGIIAIVDPSEINNIIVVSRDNSPPVIIKTLSVEQSLKAYKLPGLEGQLLFADVVPLDLKKGKLRYEYNTGHGNLSNLQFYPVAGFGKNGKYEEQWSEIEIALEQPEVELVYKSIGDGNYAVELNRNMIPNGVKEMYLNTTAPGFQQGVEFSVDGMLMGDSFYRLEGDSIFAPWQFGIKRYIRKNSQQWVIEKQPQGNAYRLFNKYSGKALSAHKVQSYGLQCIEEENTPLQLWDMEDLGNQRFRIKNRSNDLYLTAKHGKVFLEEYSSKKFQVWVVRNSDEYYFELRNSKSQDLLTFNKEEISTVSDKNLNVTAIISSYSSELSLKDFTFRTEPGDFVKPTFFNFLMEKEIEVR